MSDFKDEEDLDEMYPPTDKMIIVVSGSVTSGFKHWGPFDSIKIAVEWIETKQPFIEHPHVIYVEKPEDFPFR